MNIVIVGGGAIGLLWYQALNKITNIDICLKTKHKINDFYFTNINGNTEKIHVKTASCVKIKKADVILLCVKAFHVNQALKELNELISDNAIIILHHNGLGAYDEINHPNHKSPILALITTHGSKRVSNKSIVHTGEGKCSLGLLVGNIEKQQQINITQLLNAALPSVIWHDNIKHQQWLKLAINSVINPITAIANIPNGDLCKLKYKNQMLMLINEFVIVAKSQGYSFNAVDLLTTITEVADKTAANSSSMRADINNHKKTEIDYINGYLIKIAEAENIDVPAHKKVYFQVKVISGNAI